MQEADVARRGTFDFEGPDEEKAVCASNGTENCNCSHLKPIAATGVCHLIKDKFFCAKRVESLQRHSSHYSDTKLCHIGLSGV